MKHHSADPLKKAGVCGTTFRITLIHRSLQKGRPQTSKKPGAGGASGWGWGPRGCGAAAGAAYLFTWKRVQPVAKKSTIWRAAARPALMLASAVWAPIFLGVAKTR